MKKTLQNSAIQKVGCMKRKKIRREGVSKIRMICDKIMAVWAEATEGKMNDIT